jgi:hypothetical protein
MKTYILVDKTPVLVHDIVAWGRQFSSEDRQVALTETRQFRISTVFLGLDHQWGDGQPLLFETMVFGKRRWWHKLMYVLTGNYKFLGNEWSDLECLRCSTWEQAEEQHRQVVERWK